MFSKSRFRILIPNLFKEQVSFFTVFSPVLNQLALRLCNKEEKRQPLFRNVLLARRLKQFRSIRQSGRLINELNLYDSSLSKEDYKYCAMVFTNGLETILVDFFKRFLREHDFCPFFMSRANKNLILCQNSQSAALRA